MGEKASKGAWIYDLMLNIYNPDFNKSAITLESNSFRSIGEFSQHISERYFSSKTNRAKALQDREKDS